MNSNMSKRAMLVDKDHDNIRNKEIDQESTMTTDNNSSSANDKSIIGRCDKRDSFQGLNMQKCRECGVCVHETCYGLVSTKKKIPIGYAKHVTPRTNISLAITFLTFVHQRRRVGLLPVDRKKPSSRNQK